MFDEASLPNGVMLGFVVDPETGQDRNVALHGTPRDLMKVAALLHLDLSAEQRENIDNRSHRGPLMFTDERGSAVTVQPVSQASQLLSMAARRADDEGVEFPF